MNIKMYGIPNCDTVKKAKRENLLNRRGTTWRKLTEAERANLTESRAIQLMIANSSLIKRPIINNNEEIIVGFDVALWEEIVTTQ